MRRMGVINVLPLSVINKIAAGEVIERPASVIKELVENSLDAGATSVFVEVEDGGRKLIRVVDDGFGMGPDDLALAFGSHATSKLKRGEDLSFIATLGFRGEALASIGAISHARIVSRLRGAAEGAEVEINGGVQEPVKAKGAPEGTAVEIADLFYNVPARRKFVKSASTEFAHIVELVSRTALACPAAAFRLTHNGREVLRLLATADRRRRLGDLYGRELADELIDVESGEGPVHVTGFAAKPAHCRANARMQLTYVNGRCVRDRSIGHAIGAAYEGVLTHGRFPVAFLFLQMDPREVDVNVHPTKIEVRFHQGQMVHQTVLNAVAEALHGADLTPALDTASLRPPPERAGAPAGPAKDGEGRGGSVRPERLGGMRSAAAPTPFDREIPRPGPSASARPAGASSEQDAADRTGVCPRAFFQLRNSYIVEERADGVAIIDQHALHERIIFSDIQQRLSKARLESQRLLIPAVVNLSKAEAALLIAEKDNLTELGVEVSEFGRDAVAVNALPVLLGGCSPESVVHDFLSCLSGDARNSPVETRRLEAARMIACKAAIKAGDRLTESEMRSLVEKADALAERDTCPHGRPLCIFLPFADLERQFGR